MTVRYFKINPGSYGGELTVGTVTKEFVEFWQDQDDEDALIEHVYAVEQDDEDEVNADSPEITTDGNLAWHEVDDLEHVTGPFSDCSFSVQEITLAPSVRYEDGELVSDEDLDEMYEEDDDVEEYEYEYEDFCYGREVYTNGVDIEVEDDFIPVLQFLSEEKGFFGELIVETTEDFNPEKLAIGVVETDVGYIIETFRYDGKDVFLNTNEYSTRGKSTSATVGWLDPSVYDRFEDVE